MGQQATITAKSRSEFGTGPNRRLRATGQVPGVIYQDNGVSLTFATDGHELWMLLGRRGGRREVVEITIDGGTPIPAIFMEWQLDPVRGDVKHVDFKQVARADIAAVNAEREAEAERVSAEREAEYEAAAAQMVSEADLVSPGADDIVVEPEEDSEDAE